MQAEVDKDWSKACDCLSVNESEFVNKDVFVNRELPPLVEVDGFVVNIPKTEQVYPRYQGHSNL